MSDHRIDRICQIADSLSVSTGQNKAGASTGEQVAAALLLNRPDWSGFDHILDGVDRLGNEWLNLVIDIRRAGCLPPA